MHCSLGLDTRMGEGARLDDMSSLPDGTAMARYECRRGSPALLAESSRRKPSVAFAEALLRMFSFGLLHFALIYVMGYFLIGTMIPSTIVIATGLTFGGPLGGAFGAFIAVPVGILSYALGAITLVALLQPSEARPMPVCSLSYVRHWFVSYLLMNTKTDPAAGVRHRLLPCVSPRSRCKDRRWLGSLDRLACYAEPSRGRRWELPGRRLPCRWRAGQRGRSGHWSGPHRFALVHRQQRARCGRPCRRRQRVDWRCVDAACERGPRSPMIRVGSARLALPCRKRAQRLFQRRRNF